MKKLAEPQWDAVVRRNRNCCNTSSKRLKQWFEPFCVMKTVNFVKKIQTLLSLLLASSILSSCGLQKNKSTYYYADQLQSIEALDLSEDKSILSSKNDEILVSILFGLKIGDQWYVNGYHLPAHTFDSTSTVYLPDSVTLGSKDECETCEVWICLTEMDEDSTEELTHQKILDFVNTNGYRALDSKAAVDKVLKDNDFLGYVRIAHITANLSTEYQIIGQDLLDRYHYKISISRSVSSN